MKIILKRTGGIIPITKMAELEVNLTEEEIGRLMDAIKSAPPVPRVKDGSYYQVMIGDQGLPLNMEYLPHEYQAIFDQLKDKLKIVK